MTPQQLRASILQLAVQGKLAAQRPEEGTGGELYAQIQQEKQKLIAAGKLKKEKPLLEITEDEIPFEIPESWKWCYIGDIFQHNTGKALNASDNVGLKLTYITTSNLYWNKFVLDKLNEMYFTNEEINKCTVKKGDLLVCEGGDFGRAAIWQDDKPMRIQNHIHRLRAYLDVDIYYFYYIFFLYKTSNRIRGKGIGLKGLSSQVLHKLKVPLPPLAEQKRIVAKIEQLQPLMERYEKVYNALHDLNSRFPGDLRKSLLQLAVQGKLVAQRPEEGTGGELYAQIQQEKQKLIAAGKLKKEKPLPEITEDEIPFEIPESWKWCRLGLISSYAQSKEKVLTKDVSPNIWSLDLEDIEKTTGRIVQKITVGERQSKGDRVRFYKGQILYSKLRPYLLKILIADDDGITTSEMVPFQIYGPVEQKYFMWYLKSPFVDSTVNQSTYGVKMPRVGTETMINLLVPLPPLAEQKRIVARLQELLPLCGRLSQMNA
jgi:type I restriction enzyme S subunit